MSEGDERIRRLEAGRERDQEIRKVWKDPELSFSEQFLATQKLMPKARTPSEILEHDRTKAALREFAIRLLDDAGKPVATFVRQVHEGSLAAGERWQIVNTRSKRAKQYKHEDPDERESGEGYRRSSEYTTMLVNDEPVDGTLVDHWEDPSTRWVYNVPGLGPRRGENLWPVLDGLRDHRIRSVRVRSLRKYFQD